MDPYHEDFFVMGSIEDTDPSSFRQSQGRPPKKIMSKFLFARRLERAHFATLWIETRHHMRDDAILAGSVHPLQHDQNRPMSVGVEAFLQLRETFDVGSEKSLGFISYRDQFPRCRQDRSLGPGTAKKYVLVVHLPFGHRPLERILELIYAS